MSPTLSLALSNATVYLVFVCGQDKQNYCEHCFGLCKKQLSCVLQPFLKGPPGQRVLMLFVLFFLSLGFFASPEH